MFKFFINSASSFQWWWLVSNDGNVMSSGCCGHTKILKVLLKTWLSSLFWAHLFLFMSLLAQRHWESSKSHPEPLQLPRHLSQVVSSWRPDPILILACGCFDLTSLMVWLGVPVVWTCHVPERLWFHVNLWFSVPFTHSVRNFTLWFLLSGTSTHF